MIKIMVRVSIFQR